MTCPPSPGVLAYLSCVLAMLWANPIAIAALLLSLGAAVSAVLLARRRANHGPSRILCVVWLADVLGWILAPALASGGPFTGWLRVAQHIDSARFLVWPFAVQIMVGLAFTETRMRGEARRALLIALPSFYAFMLAITVACYPALRGEALGRFYACVCVNAAIWSLVIAGAWGLRGARRPGAHRPAASEPPEPLYSPARAVASLLVVLTAFSIVAGPWWRGLFGAAYRAEQVILCVLYAAIVGVQVWALVRPPAVACFRAPETLSEPGEIPNPFVHDRALGDEPPQA